MPQETREEQVRRVTEKIFETWKDATPDTDLIRFCTEWDPENEEAFRSLNWGYFSPDKPRHLDHKTREFVVIVIYAFKNMKGELYEHIKKALRLGATMHQLLECFQVGVAPGGLATLHVGLHAMKRARAEGLA